MDQQQVKIRKLHDSVNPPIFDVLEIYFSPTLTASLVTLPSKCYHQIEQGNRDVKVHIKEASFPRTLPTVLCPQNLNTEAVLSLDVNGNRFVIGNNFETVLIWNQHCHGRKDPPEKEDSVCFLHNFFSCRLKHYINRKCDQLFGRISIQYKSATAHSGTFIRAPK